MRWVIAMPSTRSPYLAVPIWLWSHDEQQYLFRDVSGTATTVREEAEFLFRIAPTGLPRLLVTESAMRSTSAFWSQWDGEYSTCGSASLRTKPASRMDFGSS